MSVRDLSLVLHGVLYWLQLPLRYALPIMVAMALLHWLISQCLFLVREAVFSVSGTELKSAYGCSWSFVGLFWSLVVGGVLLAALFALGVGRMFSGKMPLLGSCSLTIQAACRKADGTEGVDAVAMPSKYGAWKQRAGEGPFHRRRVGFSADEVEELEDGVVYL